MEPIELIFEWKEQVLKWLGREPRTVLSWQSTRRYRDLLSQAIHNSIKTRIMTDTDSGFLV